MSESGASCAAERQGGPPGSPTATQTAFLGVRSQWTEEELAALAEIGSVLSGQVAEVGRAWTETVVDAAAAHGYRGLSAEALIQVHSWLLEGLLVGLRSGKLDEIFQATLDYNLALLRSQSDPALRSKLDQLYQSLEACASLILERVRVLCADNPRLPLMLSAYSKVALQFASILGQAFYQVRSAELSEALRVSASMLETSRELNTRAASLDGVLLHLTQVVDRLIRAESNLTLHWDANGGSYVVHSGRGFSPTELQRLRSCRFGPEVLGLAPGASAAGIVGSAGGKLGELLAAGRARCAAVAPLAGSDGSPLGALAIFGRDKGHWSSSELRILRGVAQNGALALENASLLTQLGRQAQLREQAAGAARDAERLRLGRELHDSVLQDLGAVKLGLESALKRGSVDALPAVIDAVITTMQEVRRVVDDLRPADLSAASLRDAIAGYAQVIENGHDIACDVDLSAEVEIPSWATRDVYRIAQEAVTNAVRHAQPTTIRIQLVGDGTNAILIVRDDGSGFSLDDAVLGGGLVGMRERSMAIGATLDVITAAGAGTVVRLAMPSTTAQTLGPMAAATGRGSPPPSP